MLNFALPIPHPRLPVLEQNERIQSDSGRLARLVQRANRAELRGPKRRFRVGGMSRAER